MTPPATVDVAKADYGPYPKNYQAVLKTYFTTTLIDPYSAVIEFPEKPYKGYTRSAPITGGKPNAFGYVVKACFNAKNRFGGYVGQSCQNYLIHKGKDVYPIEPNMYFSETWYR